MTSHLRAYLDYYKQLKAPGYAVLVTGDWGVGKTHQVRKYLEEGSYYYVSLNGLTTVDDIHAAVLAEMDPKLDKAKYIIAVSSRLAALFPGMKPLGMVPSIANAILRQDVQNDRVIVFDDLERCSIDTQDKFGAINLYIEHHKCRVVVIAHDEKVIDEIHDKKEKLFGQSIKVSPDEKGAFNAFLMTSIKEHQRDFLKTYCEDIISVFQVSKVNSLRILRHVMEDLGRLYDALESDQLETQAAVRELVQVFTAYNIEFRAGLLHEKSLEERRGRSYSHYIVQARNTNLAPTRFVIAEEKYDSLDLQTDLLSNVALVQMLIHGNYDPAMIQSSLRSSAYFLEPAQSPPWRQVSKLFRLGDETVTQAIKDMQRQFDNREVTESGEILHIFALRLMMADGGLLDCDRQTVVRDAKSYIDDLVENGRLPPRDTRYGWTGDFDMAYGGIMYWGIGPGTSNPEFVELFEYLVNAREQVLEAQLPERGKDLLKLMQTDAEAFFEQLCHTNSGDNPYVIIPILAHINPSDFVEAWLQSPPEFWITISSVFKTRYEGGRLSSELKDEKEWLSEVRRLFEEKESKAPPLTAMRIRWLVPRNIPDLDKED